MSTNLKRPSPIDAPFKIMVNPEVQRMFDAVAAPMGDITKFESPPGVSRNPEDYQPSVRAEEMFEATRVQIQGVLDDRRDRGINGMTSALADPTISTQENIEAANRMEQKGGGWMDDHTQPASEQEWNKALKFIESHEGYREEVYDDKTGKQLLPGDKAEGFRTVGIGINIEPDGKGKRSSRLRKLFKTVGADYDKIYDGKASLNRTQAESLFFSMAKDRASKLRKIFKDVDMGNHRWRALLSLVYNSKWEGAWPTLIPKGSRIAAAIRRGDWMAASDEIEFHSEANVEPNQLDGMRSRRSSEAILFRGSGGKSPRVPRRRPDATQPIGS